jgi:steroid delta-isomerase-like uncharacterized protein
MAETTTAPETITTEWAADFGERWFAAWSSQQPGQVLELITDDIVFDDSYWPQTMRGHAQVREYAELLFRAFPDLTFVSAAAPLVASDGPWAMLLWRSWATNTGPLDPLGLPATGKRYEGVGAEFHEYRDGKLARLMVVFDAADIMRQLGLLPEGDSVG